MSALCLSKNRIGAAGAVCFSFRAEDFAHHIFYAN